MRPDGATFLSGYFERLRKDPLRWGKPFAALLGALEAQLGLELAAIGGKDSMSGSFNELDVPPTLISFAVAPNDAAYVLSPEFKTPGNNVALFEASDDLPDVRRTWKTIHHLVKEGDIVSAWSVTDGGVLEGLFKMSLGNRLGFLSAEQIDADSLSVVPVGSIIAEAARPVPDARVIGRVRTVDAVVGAETAGSRGS